MQNSHFNAVYIIIIETFYLRGKISNVQHKQKVLKLNKINKKNKNCYGETTTQDQTTNPLNSFYLI